MLIDCFLQSPRQALNRMAREDPNALDIIATWGGRELLEQAAATAAKNSNGIFHKFSLGTTTHLVIVTFFNVSH